MPMIDARQEMMRNILSGGDPSIMGQPGLMQMGTQPSPEATQPTPAAQPGQVDTRQRKGQMFKAILSDFLLALGEGLSGAGTGPGADARGAGIAATSGYRRRKAEEQTAFEREKFEETIQQRKTAADQIAAYREGLLGVQQQGMEMTDITLPDGQTVQVPRKNAASLQSAIVGAKAGVQKAEIGAETQAKKLEAGKEERASRVGVNNARAALAQAQKEAISDPNNPEFQRKVKESESRLAMAQQGMELRREQMALNRERLQMQLERPTAQSRATAEFAQSLTPHIEEARDMIENLDKAGKLGPIAGRWSEFIAGKIGSGDPEYAELRSTMGLLQTGLMRVHVGAHGGVQLLTKFQSLMNSDKMDKATLLGTMKSYESFVSGYAKLGQKPSDGGGRFATKEEMLEIINKVGPNNEKAVREMLKSRGLKIPPKL